MFFIQDVQDILGGSVRQILPSGASAAKIIGDCGKFFIKYVSKGRLRRFSKRPGGWRP